MKKLFTLIFLLLSMVALGQQVPPNVSRLIQLNQNTMYLDPTTGLRWGFNGTTHGWYRVDTAANIFVSSNFKNLGVSAGSPLDLNFIDTASATALVVGYKSGRIYTMPYSAGSSTNLGNSDLTQSDPTRVFNVGDNDLTFLNGADGETDIFAIDSVTRHITANIGITSKSAQLTATRLTDVEFANVSVGLSSGSSIWPFIGAIVTDSLGHNVGISINQDSSKAIVIIDQRHHIGLTAGELFTVSGDPNQYMQFGNAPSGGGNTIYSADDSIHNTDRQVSLNQHFLGFLGTTNSDFNVQIHDAVNHIGSEADNIASEIQIQVADTTNNLFSAMEVAPGQAENVTTDNSTQGNFDLESLGDQTTMDMSVTVNSTATKTGIVVATPGGAFEPGIIGKDENYLIGFKYPAGESYATNGKRYNEWIPDWGTVKAGLDSIRSISGTTLYNGDGSTTDSTRTATIIKDLLFNEVDGVTGESATLSIGRTNGIDLATNVPSVSSAEIKVNSQFGESNAQMNYSDNTTGNQKGITISANGLKIIDQIDHIGADANEVFPVSAITQYAQYGKVDSIAIAKADSVGATIGGASVTFHPNAAGDVISTLVTGPTLSPTLIINNNVNLTGNPTTTTQTSGNSSTRIATTAFVAAAVSGVTVPTAANPTASAGTTAVNGSATTFMRSDAAPKVDSAAFTTKALIGTYLTKAQVVATYAPLASPALTGTPTAPTATLGTNTTQLATTAFVLANAGSTTFANPTASIGVTAVNGSATTAMRSDAAPKADTSVLRTVANSYSLSGMQTKLNNYALTSSLPVAGNPSGLLTYTAANGSATTYERTDGLHAIDSTVVRSVANSYSLSGMQTKLGNYVLGTTTVAGFALSSNVSLGALTATDATLTFSGSYNGSTARTVGVNLANQNIWTAAPIIQKNSIATTLTDGVYLQNNTASTSGAVKQISPSLHFGARVWNTTATAADNWSDWVQYADVTSGTAPVGTLTWANSLSTTSTPTYTGRMFLSNTGVLTASSFSSAGTNSFTGTTQLNINQNGSNLWVPVTFPATTTSSYELFAGASSVMARIISAANQTGTTFTAGQSYAGLLLSSPPVMTTASTGTSAMIANQVIRPIGTITFTGSANATNTASLFVQGAATVTVTGSNYGIYGIGLNRLDTLQTTQFKFGGSFGTSGQMPIINGSGALSWVTAYTGLITGTPTIVAGTGAGTGPTVSVTTNGKQLQVTVTTGTLPTGTNATIATVTLPNPLTYTPLPVFSSASAATALLSGASMIFMTSTGTANVTITSGTTALTAATTYVWNVTL